jgi:hypothetical protein
VRKKMKQDQELKTYYTPELKKIGTVKELTQGARPTDPDDISGSPDK